MKLFRIIMYVFFFTIFMIAKCLEAILDVIWKLIQCDFGGKVSLASIMKQMKGVYLRNLLIPPDNGNSTEIELESFKRQLYRL